MEILFADKYGRATGTHSAYQQSYAARESVINDLAVATDYDNLKNNFLQFEKEREIILRTQIQDMLINLFHYKNVPETLNTAQLETMLRQFGGGVCVGKDELGDLVILGQPDELGLNIYGSITPSFYDGTNNYFKDKKQITHRNLTGDYVVFYNKLSFQDFYSTDFSMVRHFTKLLALIKATERMNVLQMRAPYVFKGKKNGVNGQIFMRNLLSGELFMEIAEGTELETKIDVLPLSVQDRTQTLQNEYRNTMNEMLTLFGVYNNPESKQDRKISGEVSANNHVIEGMGDIYFNARRQAIDLVNRAFGYDIQVEWNSTVATSFRNLVSNQRQGTF